MKRMEPVSNWQAFWLVFLSSGGAALVLLLAGVSTPVASQQRINIDIAFTTMERD